MKVLLHPVHGHLVINKSTNQKQADDVNVKTADILSQPQHCCMFSSQLSTTRQEYRWDMTTDRQLLTNSNNSYRHKRRSPQKQVTVSPIACVCVLPCKMTTELLLLLLPLLCCLKWSEKLSRGSSLLHLNLDFPSVCDRVIEGNVTDPQWEQGALT